MKGELCFYIYGDQDEEIWHALNCATARETAATAASTVVRCMAGGCEMRDAGSANSRTSTLGRRVCWELSTPIEQTID